MKRVLLALAAGLLAALSPTASAQTSVTWPSTGTWGSQYYARSGDFNGDGYADIASPSGSTLFKMKINNGLSGPVGFTGSDWTPTASFSWPSDSSKVQVGDFNCDGADDFAFQQNNATQWGMIFVKNNNTFSGGYSQTFTPEFHYYNTLAGPSTQNQKTRVGDRDGDGCDELWLVNAAGTMVHILQPGAGTALSKLDYSIGGTWGPDDGMFLGDFDCDGNKDDYASFNGSNVYMKKLGSGFTMSTETVSPSTWGWGGYAEAGTFTTSGGAPECYWDVAIPSGGTIYLKTNTHPNFSGSTWSVTNLWNSPEWTFAGDFNHDGRTDFASANGSTSVYMKLSP